MHVFTNFHPCFSQCPSSLFAIHCAPDEIFAAQECLSRMTLAKKLFKSNDDPLRSIFSKCFAITVEETSTQKKCLCCTLNCLLCMYICIYIYSMYANMYACISYVSTWYSISYCMILLCIISYHTIILHYIALYCTVLHNI